MATRTILGTGGDDRLAGSGKDAVLLKGLGGDDGYTLRLFTKTLYNENPNTGEPIGDPSEAVYVRDQVKEYARSGYDTVKLVNHYEPFEFTGITPGGSATASQLANIEHIVAAETKRGGKLIGWSIAAGKENNLIEAPGGNDTLDGGGGNDTIKGGGGADRLLGGSGDDRLFAGSGDDTLIGGAGKDLLDGGAGSDRVSFELERHGVTLNLATGANSTNDRLRGIEDALGSKGWDTLTGSAAANRLAGMDGDDKLYGGKGDDALLGGKGDDTLSGGEGRDALDSGGGTDRLTGGAGGDRFEFAFATKQVLVGLGYVRHQRQSSFEDTITDFQDGSDRLALDGVFTARNLQHPVRGGFDLFTSITWSQVGGDTRIDFGDPTRSGTESRESDVYFGSVTLKHFDADKLSAADFLFV